MTSYLANHIRNTPSDTDADRDLAPQPSLATRLRRSSGMLLIALGERLTGANRPALREPADDAARAMS